MGFGICPACGGYWCSVGGFVNYCVCKPADPAPKPTTPVAHPFVRDNQDACHVCGQPEDAAIHGASK